MTHRLDGAINHVAARMTHVEEDDALAMRIVAQLPDRRSPWLPYGWLPRFAVGALATLAIIVVLRSFDNRSTTVLRTENTPNPRPTTVEPSSNDRRTAVEPALIVRRTIAEPSLNGRRTRVDIRRTPAVVDRPDFDRSLAAIAATEPLGVVSLTPADLPEDASLTIESLEIADLPLTADFSPR